MSETSIRIELVGRAYPLTVHPEEEMNIRRAAQEINESITRLKEAYPLTDKQGKPIKVPTWEFPGGNKVEKSVLRKERLANRAEWWLDHLPDTHVPEDVLEWPPLPQDPQREHFEGKLRPLRDG